MVSPVFGLGYLSDGFRGYALPILRSFLCDPEDGQPPFAGGFAGPFVGGVEAGLGAHAGSHEFGVAGILPLQTAVRDVPLRRC